MISADAVGDQAKRMTAAGAHAYLTKPLDLREFFLAIEAALKGRSKAAL